jgi:hypothetical protein
MDRFLDGAKQVCHLLTFVKTIHFHFEKAVKFWGRTKAGVRFARAYLTNLSTDVGKHRVWLR